MLCSGCGKNIPFVGAVCPYCQRDKSYDKSATLWVFIFIPILSATGYSMLGYFGAFIGFIMAFILASGAGKSKPPEVKIYKEGEQIGNENKVEVSNTFSNESIVSKNEKECPKCAETVKYKAVICRYCGYNFPNPTLEEINEDKKININNLLSESKFKYIKFDDNYKELINKRLTINALKLLRDVTNLSLKEAKDIVDLTIKGESLDNSIKTIIKDDNQRVYLETKLKNYKN